MLFPQTPPPTDTAQSSPPPALKAARPAGLWLATLWAGIFAGVVPVGLVLLLYFGPAKGSETMSGLQLALSVGLGAAIVVAAVGAWRGSRSACYALVALLVVHYALVAYQNYQLASAGVEVRGSSATPGRRAVRSLFTAAIIGGYLIFSKDVRQFCARPKG